MKRISVIVLFAMMAFSSILFAQPGSGNGMPEVNFQITGIVLDSVSGKPVEYATVALVSLRDSSIAGGTITDSKGYFSFNSKVPGKFILRVNFMGYAIKNKGPVFMKPGTGPVFDQGTILINPSATSLSGVEIVADRPMIELSIDKKVVNVSQNLTATGGTALDVLKDVPSVEVDQDGNVSMRGSENVTILIDGRPSTLTGADRRAALEQIQAGSIESVELITNPSAKYSPDGMTGIINIILKKKKGSGLNSLLSLNAGTGNKYNGNFALSYSTDKWTLFGNFDYSNRERIGEGWSNRTTYSLIDSYFLHQDFDNSSKDISYSTKIGGEYYFSPKLILSGSASYRSSTDNGIENAISYTQNHTGDYTSIYKNINLENESGYNYDAMLNLKKRFSKPKNEITFDFSYSYGNSNDSSLTRLSFLEEDFSTISSETPIWTKTATPNTNKIFTGKIDYVYPFNDSTKLEAGFDGSLRMIDADSRYFDYSFGTSEWNYNDTTSNHFLFNETIGALYVNYSTKIKKWGFSLGSRLELANTNAREADSSNNIKSYNSWYPTGAVSYKLAKLQEIQITYSRRINRPSFESLNPFYDYSAYPNIRTGNPYLNPEYINSFELGYAYYSPKGTFMPSIFFKKVNDVMTRYRENINDSVYLMTWENYNSATSYGFEMIYSTKVFKWWNLNLSGQWYKVSIDGSNVETSITGDSYGWQLRTSNSFRFPKSWESQLSFFYNGPRFTGQGTRGAFIMSDIAIKKSFFNSKLALSLRVQDLLNSMKFNIVFEEADYQMEMLRRHEGRMVFLGLTWKLSGDYKSKEKKRSGDGGGMEDDGF